MSDKEREKKGGGGGEGGKDKRTRFKLAARNKIP